MQSKVQSPKSKVGPGRTPHHPPLRRSGVTLLEVLFAIMVASVGLLGAIAVFPVAISQIRKAIRADSTAVAAEAAISKFDAELMRRPDRWLYWDATNSQTQFLPQAFNQSSNAFFGYSFCIDPYGFEHNRLEDLAGGTNNSALWSRFPAVPEVAGNNAVPNSSRMYRLTLYNNDPNQSLTIAQKALKPMSLVQADKVFRIEDDLTFQRPSDNSLPAVQLYTQMQVGGANVAARRQEDGRLTWFATLVPKLDRLGGQLGEEYVLSIVVCWNRSGESTHVPGSGPETHPWNEWTAKILGPNTLNANGDFYASGIGGGEVTLTTNDPNNSFTGTMPLADQLAPVVRGSWVMLGRTIPHSSGAIQYFQWYRVSDSEESARQVTVNNVQRYQRDVTLIGPDWPADVQAADGLPEECDVIIMPHVVYVYERTIKIDTGAVQ